jgi:hypothetical protein
MDHKSQPWFSVGIPGSTKLRCCVCRKEIDLGFPSLDHHSSWCPACGVESLFFSWKDMPVQLALTRVPKELLQVIRWTQENLDEPEFITVLVSLTELAESLQRTAEVVPSE